MGQWVIPSLRSHYPDALFPIPDRRRSRFPDAPFLIPRPMVCLPLRSPRSRYPGLIRSQFPDPYVRVSPSSRSSRPSA